MYSFRSGSEFDIETLARLYTRTFEGYAHKAVITPHDLETWIEVEDLRLDLSPVLCVGDDKAGFTTVGLRKEHAYCRGFGIVPEYRGRGLANALALELVARARSVRAVDMVLGVLIDNTHAVKSYRASGFTPTRELHTVEWERDSCRAYVHAQGVVEIEPASALARFDDLHRVPPVWNRDLPSLVKMQALRGLGVISDGVLGAYVLYRRREDGAEILDLAAAHPDEAERLVCTVQAEFDRVVCYNEPDTSPALDALRACDFVLTQRRYEMRVGGLT